jgi:tetratricopeptide (TPR) repeat protein
MERAKLLDQLIDANGKLVPFGSSKIAPTQVRKWQDEIVQLDADGKGGFKIKYEFPRIVREASTLASKKKFDEAQATLDKVLAVSGIAPQQIQEGMLYKGIFYRQENNSAKALECFDKALKAAPEGRYAPTIKVLAQQAQQKAKKAGEPAKKEESKTQEN